MSLDLSFRPYKTKSGLIVKAYLSGSHELVGSCTYHAKELRGKPALEIYVIITDPDFQRMGVATGIINWTEDNYAAKVVWPTEKWITPKGAKLKKSLGKRK